MPRSEQSQFVEAQCLDAEDRPGTVGGFDLPIESAIGRGRVVVMAADPASPLLTCELEQDSFGQLTSLDRQLGQPRSNGDAHTARVEELVTWVGQTRQRSS